MKINGTVKRFINLAITVALLIFAWFYISGLIKQANFSEISFNWKYVFISVILFCGYYGLMSLNWLLSARQLDSKVGAHQYMVFLASQPYKYLPTSLFIFSSRAVFAKKLGMTYKHSSIAQLLENGVLIVANITLFLFLFLLNNSLRSGLFFALVVILVSIIIYKLNKVKINFKKINFIIETNRIIYMFYICVVGWLLCGLAFATFNKALGLSFELINLLAANTIAFSLSMLAFFAPGGIGVRELVYDKFSISSVAILYWRILVFVMDMLIGVPFIIILKLKSRELSTTS